MNIEDCPSECKPRWVLQSPLLVHLCSILVLGYFGSILFPSTHCIFYCEFGLLKNIHHIPMHLPPKRDIQHHIVLIPCSILPTKPAYRINPQETMEIQRQVEELMSKGLIHESLGPYTVPALLVPKKDGS